MAIVFSGKYKVASAPKVDSAVLKKAQKAKKIIIGVKADQPFLGFKDPATGKYSGFDIEIAKMVAADLGFSEKQITFKTIDSNVRETTISKGDGRLLRRYVHDQRRAQEAGRLRGPVLHGRRGPPGAQGREGHQGPGLPQGQEGLLDRRLHPAPGDQEAEVRRRHHRASRSTPTASSSCWTAQVDAVTTDDAILKGYAAQRPEKLKVVDKPFTKEPYGVGMNKDDKALRDAITDALENHIKNGDYKKAYEGTLGKSGSSYVAPETPLPRY